MEQVAGEASIPKPTGAPQVEQPSWFAGLRRDLRMVRGQVAAITAFALAGMAGAVLTDQAPDVNRALPAPTPKVKGVDYKPITDLNQVGGGNEAVQEEASSALASYGYTTDIIQPDKELGEAYSSFFHTQSIDVERPPSLEEVIHVQDKNTFSEVYERHSRYYPFDIYNSTGKPVDLVFVSYALRATQLWLNKTSGAEGPDIEIGDDTLADLKPISNPHIMVLVDKIPPGAKNTPRSTTEGVTSRTPGRLTRSFIENSGSLSEPFRHKALATEICQSLVDVTDGRAAPGMQPQQRLILEKTGSLFHRPSKVYGVDLASQERVCNGLGSYVTAAYEKDPRLPNTTFGKFIFRPTAFIKGGLPIEAQWEDYDLYRPGKEAFLRLAQRVIHRDYNEVIASHGAHSPTLDFYRHNREF